MSGARLIAARFASKCGACSEPIGKGDPILYVRGAAANHEACGAPTPNADAPTTRERREARADRLESWSASNAARGAADVARARDMASVIPFGQPIHVGHHSERADRNYRARIGSTFDRGFTTLHKAQDQASRAEGIRAQADAAIYSDDADALVRLGERVTALEAERERIKRYNATCRKGAPDLSILDEAQRRSIESTIATCPTWCPGGAFPPYHLSNLSGNIKRNRDRLARLTREALR